MPIILLFVNKTMFSSNNIMTVSQVHPIEYTEES